MGKIMLNNIDYSGSGSSGSTVTVTPLLDRGVQIASIDVDGQSFELYAPTGGGGSDIQQMSILNKAISNSTVSATGEVTS